MEVSGVRRSCVTASSSADFSFSLCRKPPHDSRVEMHRAARRRRSISRLPTSASSARRLARPESCPAVTGGYEKREQCDPVIGSSDLESTERRQEEEVETQHRDN